ncbi:hypothetical protein HYPSUDRAFT_49351 [Hypholoma sublateritium FD-334 SS-4]|uniref:DUF6534 domain-containing protein n=1 Tax=Hypholoma sublateritium (strain FD-334 SS-4) TaxID=945553 RepID=A0A0D2P0P8_HYPSF|nr:hypothetical protein HYPSUDRAFT_49351 [Hypholoma sublateritium FD-334 SS-4]
MASYSFSLANTFGALEIGVSVAIFLFGVVTVQTYTYFRRFPDDRLYFKALVGTLWTLELGHTIIIMYELYRTTIVLFGIPSDTLPQPALGGLIIIGTFIASLTQMFFCHRIFTILPAPLRLIGPATALVAAVRCGLVVYTGTVAIRATSYVAFVLKMHSWVLVLLALAAVIDTVIAAAMVGFLLTARERSLSRTTRLVDRLIGFTLRTGLLTSIAAVAVIICYKVMPYNFIFLAVYTSFSKLYTSSLVSGFNSRASLRETRSGSADVLNRTDGPARFPFPAQGTVSLPYTSNNAIAVEMKTTTEFRSDDTSDGPGYRGGKR